MFIRGNRSRFLGFRVDKEGIHPSRSKVEAIHAAPIPADKQQLQAFLGLINFYHSFLKERLQLQSHCTDCWTVMRSGYG
ncbi:hypothetical protein JTE90_029340 [Oedothorax gibbosus]|uniref:Uncharacterized protein n=1 Tax=Oedothorax gibbosus TaxID=931172 RepID=A0AAV6UHV2_9ARAC|nr:hypothetical protein JTE90_029340 [Oedothorax gibbosus]